jgi:RNA polymerase sigma-70 factor (ECF subfamily)
VNVYADMECSIEQQTRADLVSLLPRLRRFARSLTGNRHQADDLVQETMVRAIVAGNDPSGAARVDAWTFRIMRNAWIDMLKARRVRQDYADAVCAMSREENGGENTAMASLMLDAVQAAMRSLPEEQRIVLLLVCVEQFSYAQVAEMLAVPIGTVMSRLARGRTALRHLVGSRGELDRSSTEPVIRAAK